MSDTRTLLIAGAQGVAGGGIQRAAAQEGVWTVTTSRRAAGAAANAGGESSHIVTDLLDREGTQTAMAVLQGPVDVAFAAYAEQPEPAEAIRINVGMLQNLLDALDRPAVSVGRVVLITGAKAYGPHLGPYKTPGKESDPRVIGPLGYYDQADALAAWADRHGVGWTELRPDGIIGPSIGSPMNLLQGIAAYGAVNAELGLPLRFPGRLATWDRVLHQLTDADLLGRAVLWAIRSEAACNEIFNVVNGDQLRWANLWPDLARFWSIDVDVPKTASLTAQMAGCGDLWKRMIARHGLRSTPWDAFVSWGFVEAVWNIDYDLVQSTVKIRQAGFHDAIDSHVSVIGHLQRLRDMRAIP